MNKASENSDIPCLRLDSWIKKEEEKKEKKRNRRRKEQDKVVFANRDTSDEALIMPQAKATLLPDVTRPSLLE